MSIAVLFSFLFIFSNCKKDDPPKKNPYLLIQAHEGYWKPKDAPCEEKGFFCNPPPFEYSDEAFEKVVLEVGEIAGTGVLIPGLNEDILKFNFSKTNLSQERANQLIEEKVIEVVAHEFNPYLVKELYEQAGATYHGEPLMIEGGLYDIEVDGTGTPTVAEIEIEIEITYSHGTLHVRIKISW